MRASHRFAYVIDGDFERVFAFWTINLKMFELVGNIAKNRIIKFKTSHFILLSFVLGSGGSLHLDYRRVGRYLQEKLEVKNVKSTTQGSYIEEQKRDAEEMMDILKIVPEEEKKKVYGIIIGFALGVESRGKEVV